MGSLLAGNNEADSSATGMVATIVQSHTRTYGDYLLWMALIEIESQGYICNFVSDGRKLLHYLRSLSSKLFVPDATGTIKTLDSPSLQPSTEGCLRNVAMKQAPAHSVLGPEG